MNSVQRGAIILLVATFFAHNGIADAKTYAAIVKPGGAESTTVTIEAKDYQEAKDRITGIYCGGRDCIIEGPWEKH